MGNWNKNEEEIISLSNILVNEYLQLHQALKRSDLIVALGSGVELTALRVAELCQQDLAPRVLLTGYGPDVKKECLPESLNFCNIVTSNGVSKENIIIEKESTNTLQNANFSRTTLETLDLFPQSAIIVTVPFHERRALATFQKQWPEVQLTITSPKVDMVLYTRITKFSSELIGKKVIHEIENIQSYGAKGDIIEQPFPWNLSDAYKRLCQLIFAGRN
jgi:uncharacterized SAM-binding protein YcdF (DUF218 family)